MTLAEMTPDSWRLLAWIAVGLVFVWSAAWLWWAVRKVDKDSEAGESPKDW